MKTDGDSDVNWQHILDFPSSEGLTVGEHAAVFTRTHIWRNQNEHTRAPKRALTQLVHILTAISRMIADTG